MKSTQAYYVNYRMNQFGKEEGICVPAKSKAEAYDKAVYELIPELKGQHPYSAWVYSVTYNNGNCHYFNTCEGLAY